MQKFLVFLIVSLFSLHVSSQNFGTRDSEWVYNFSGNFIAGVTKISYEKDTLIGTRDCRKFIREYLYDIPSPLPNKQIFFSTNKTFVEYSFTGIDFEILYNFGAAKGTTYKVIHRSEFNNMVIDSVLARVDSIFQTQINGKTLLTQLITYAGLTRNFTYQDTIYETIGPKLDYIFPWDREARQRDGGEGGAMRCFHHPDLGLVEFDSTRYINRYEYNCEKLVSIDGVPVPDYQLDFYPNPVVDKLQIESFETTQLEIEVIDMMGRRLGKVNILPGKNELDLSSYASGIYLMSIEGRAVRRIVKK